MATYIEIYNLRYSINLHTRVQVAISKAAQDVINESAATPNHTNRVAWAKKALESAKLEADRMMWGVVGNASIQTNGEASSDSDIQFVVNGLIDTFATPGVV